MKSTVTIIVAIFTVTAEICCKDIKVLANWDAFMTDLNKKSVLMLFLCLKDQPRCGELNKSLLKQCDSHASFICDEYIDYIPNNFTRELNSGDAIPYIAFFKGGNKTPVIELKETDDTTISGTDIDNAFKDSKLS